MKQNERAIIKKIRIEGRKNDYVISIIDIIYPKLKLYIWIYQKYMENDMNSKCKYIR